MILGMPSSNIKISRWGMEEYTYCFKGKQTIKQSEKGGTPGPSDGNTPVSN